MIATLGIDESADSEVKKIYYCKKCKQEFDHRLHRGLFVKTLLFWLPLRKYACYHCKRNYYVFR
jgi:hypothetical protein